MRYIVYTLSGYPVGDCNSRSAADSWAKDMYDYRNLKCYVAESENGTECENKKSGSASH
jgi:hypothetical protein